MADTPVMLGMEMDTKYNPTSWELDKSSEILLYSTSCRGSLRLGTGLLEILMGFKEGPNS